MHIKIHVDFDGNIILSSQKYLDWMQINHFSEFL